MHFHYSCYKYSRKLAEDMTQIIGQVAREKVRQF